MNPVAFCYWLQGLLEVGKPQSLDAEQLKIIAEHLALVFKYESGASPQTVGGGIYGEGGNTEGITVVASPPTYPVDEKPFDAETLKRLREQLKPRWTGDISQIRRC